ncbi:hypothetical protein ACHAPV_003912 [Trichoderma viride]
MPEGEASQAQNPSQNASRGAPRARRGRGRGGRGRGGHHHGDQAQTAQGQPAPQQAGSETPSNLTANLSQQEPAASGNSSRSSRGGRGRRGPRQSERGGARHSAPRAPLPGPSRRFGGHLTVEVDDADAEADAPELSAEAPEFVPGQPVLPRAKPRKSETSRQPEVRLPKSTATDLGTRIHEDISNGNYECASLKRTSLGGVPAVTPNCLMSQAPTTAGVERTSTRGPLVPHFLHTLADRHAQNLGEHVLTLVVSNATLALVRRVPL